MSNTGDPADEPIYDGERAAGDDTVVIHRSPRYFRFMAAGAILGVVIALVLTFAFPEPPGFNVAQIFGFLAILLVVVGVALGAVVALVIDRASRSRAKTIKVERIEAAPGDESPGDEPVPGEQPAPGRSAPDAPGR